MAKAGLWTTICFIGGALFTGPAHAGIALNVSDGVLEAVTLTADLSVPVTAGAADSGLLVAIKGVYGADSTFPGWDSLADPQLLANARAELSGGSVSDASLFMPWPEGRPVDPESGPGRRDLLLLYDFFDHDPFFNPWTLTAGATVTLRAGTLWALSDFLVPAPDSLAPVLSLQVFTANGLQPVSDLQNVPLVPEPGGAGLLLGLAAAGVLVLRHRGVTHPAG